MIKHPLKPIYNKSSKILILGTMPSVKSREYGFYYAHPQNRFWKILEIVFDAKIINKEEFLFNNNIALWDVIKSCDIEGSSDSSIKNVIPNDIKSLINKTKIKYIFCTGKTAYNLYNKYIYKSIKIKAICLPSPSPANCKITMDEMIKEYTIIKNCLKEE